VALAASGTVSLELAASQTPMVIAYDMSWLSRMIISRMLLVDTVTLVNLVSDTRHVPEFIGARCRAELIAPAVQAVFQAPQAQQAAMALTMQRLGQGGQAPGLRAARAVLQGLGRG
jgi:lipid-A-disaccharide synthase